MKKKVKGKIKNPIIAASAPPSGTPGMKVGANVRPPSAKPNKPKFIKKKK